MILGVDEVGRGPWAGPLVVGAVVLSCEIEGLTDSKKLSKKRRETLYDEIYEKAAGIGLGWVHPDELDRIGMSQALIEATKQAVGEITAPYHEIIIDGTVNFLKDTGKGRYVTTMKKADLLISSVSAASIVAKVARDRYMEEQSELYPDYDFGTHVGYGTAAHRAAIEKYGVTPLHRLSFAPLQKYAAPPERSRPDLEHMRVTSKQIGDRAEEVVASYLQSESHEIIERNWKTKFCEIDIVSRKGDTIYFTEVKYRKNANQGGGIAAITPKKLRQMKFAAEYFALKHQSNHANLHLATASVTGATFIFEAWLAVDSSS